MPPVAFNKRRSDVVEIRGTANASVDTAMLQAAVSAANTANVPVTFEFSGSVYLNAALAISAPISMAFRPGAEIVRAASGAAIRYGVGSNPWDAPSSQLGSTAAGSPFLTTTAIIVNNVVTTPALTLAVGDYVFIWSVDNVTTPDFTPHTTVSRFATGEIHKISRVVTVPGAPQYSNSYVTNDRTDDPFTVTPRIRKISMLSGVRIEGMKARSLPGVSVSSANWMEFAYCADLILKDCTFGPWYPGAITFYCCYNVERTGLQLNDLENPNTDLSTVYGILDRLSTRMDVNNCTFRTVRHGYSTGAGVRAFASGVPVFANEYRHNGGRVYRANNDGTTGGTAPSHFDLGATTINGISWTDMGEGDVRCGTVRNFRVANCKAGTNGRQNISNSWSGISPFDTHSEAIRGTFENNTATMPNEGGNIGFTIRGRNIVISNNTVYGGTNTIPVQMQSSNCTVVNNTFIGGHRCEIIDKVNTNPNLKNVRFIGNKFIDFYNPGIIVYNGNDHIIDDNDFINCGYLFNNVPNIPSSALYLKAGIGHRVTNNRLRKYANKLSIMFEDGQISPLNVTVENNTMTGYGDWNDGTRHPQWQANKSIALYDMVWVSSREYRVTAISVNNQPASTGTTGNTAPTHFDGTATVDNITYQFVRIIAFYNYGFAARKYMPRNGFGKASIVGITGHGLTNASRYRPINDDGSVLDNLTEPKSRMILLDVLNEDTVIVAYAGDQVDVPPLAINNSFSMTQPVDLYWDSANLDYKTTAPQNNVADPVIRALYQDFEAVRILVL